MIWRAALFGAYLGAIISLLAITWDAVQNSNGLAP